MNTNNTPINAVFQICGIRCATCDEPHFMHIIKAEDADKYRDMHDGHQIVLDVFFTKPSDYAGKRTKMTLTPRNGHGH